MSSVFKKSSAGAGTMKYRIVDHDPAIESVLNYYKADLGKDYSKYRNHVYRVYNYSLYQLDLSKQDEIALAAVFHDIGIWSDNTFDYLEPSIHNMKNHLKDENDKTKIEIISAIIYWHHKRSPYSGQYQEWVEAFRKADWMDVTLGIRSCGIPNKIVGNIKKLFPYDQFHIKLIHLSLRNFIKHPTNPLPMFKT